MFVYIFSLNEASYLPTHCYCMTHCSITAELNVKRSLCVSIKMHPLYSKFQITSSLPHMNMMSKINLNLNRQVGTNQGVWPL